MFFILKFSIYFAISFLILSFPVTKKTLFSLIHSQTNKYTNKIFQNLSNKTEESLKTGKYYSKKIFSNSEPTIQDKVFSKFSSTQKDHYMDQEVEEVYKELEGEKFTNEEKQTLDRILKETH